MDSVFATRLSVDGANALIVSHASSVTRWAVRYIGPWWGATTVQASDLDAFNDPVITAEIDTDQYADIASRIFSGRYEVATYARATVLVSRIGKPLVMACAPTERLALRARPTTGQIEIFGADPLTVSVAASRFARDVIKALLERNGWVPVHASAVVRMDRCLLVLGPARTGKTTLAMLLARTHKWDLLANDRAFVRVDHGFVRVLPWPTAAAIGLGLLDALGWFDIASARIRDGEQPYPTQNDRVTAALHDQIRGPLHEDGDRELKAQVFPDQLKSWFGIRLASTGRVAGLLFPSVVPDARPAALGHLDSMDEANVIDADAESGYPDILDLAVVDAEARDRALDAVRHHLLRVPRYQLTLSHDATGNARLLETLADSI
jgi:hypothetical protein